MPDEGPLTEADLTELKKNLVELDKADRLIEKAERAGIDVGTQKERAAEARDRLIKMKQAFWPGQ